VSQYPIFDNLDKASKFAKKEAVRIKKQKDNFEITTMANEERVKHLRYYIRLFGMSEVKNKKYAVLLDLITIGYPIKTVAKIFKVPVSKFARLEIEAMSRFKDFANELQDKGTPLIARIN